MDLQILSVSFMNYKFGMSSLLHVLQLQVNILCKVTPLPKVPKLIANSSLAFSMHSTVSYTSRVSIKAVAIDGRKRFTRPEERQTDVIHNINVYS